MSSLGAKHTVSILFVWFLADLGIALVLSMCTARLLGKVSFSLLAQSSNTRRVGLFIMLFHTIRWVCIYISFSFGSCKHIYGYSFGLWIYILVINYRTDSYVTFS